MTLELRVLSGSRAGTDLRFDKPEVTVGRHAMSDLRFDPQQDLDVSTRHAEIREAGAVWIVADQGSTNGTLVNGERVVGEHVLNDGDIISFGANGPRVEVRGVGVTAPRTVLQSANAAPATPSAKPRVDTGVRVAIAVDEKMKSTRRTFALAIGALVVVGIAGFTYTQRQGAAREKEVAALLARGDSNNRALQASLASMRPGDTAMMNRMKMEIAQRESELERARAMVASGSLTKGSVEELSRKMQGSAIPQMDYARVRDANDAAVAMVVSDLDGKNLAGTAFSISAAGLMVTNRHVVHTESGAPARRVAVLFANTKGWMPAHIVRVSDTDDLALIQVDVPGIRPVVSGVSRTGSLAAVGSAVASIGYPLANDTPMEGAELSSLTARTTLTSGMVSKRLDDVLQMDSFAGHGSSGSPLFDATGNVVGVIYGGAKESGGRIVYAVPAPRLTAFLGADGTSLLR